MITKSELKEYAKLKRLNLGQSEKEYFQNIVLFIIYERVGREMVFKGGTAMNRCYNLNRFSEDLDFTVEEIKLRKVLDEGLTRFYIDYELSETENHFKDDFANAQTSLRSNDFKDGTKIIIRLKGPLFMGKRQSMCKIELDLSFREIVILEPKIETIGRFLKEIPVFDVVVMHEEEILAEKVRAIMTRTRARDVYDLAFLLDRNTKINIELIEEKLKYYDISWNYKQFAEGVNNAEGIWKTELEPLLLKLPDFRVNKDKILNIFKKFVE